MRPSVESSPISCTGCLFSAAETGRERFVEVAEKEPRGKGKKGYDDDGYHFSVSAQRDDERRNETIGRKLAK